MSVHFYESKCNLLKFSVQCIADESSAYFENADVYRNSEFYNLGDSDGEAETEDGSFDSIRKKMTPLTEDKGRTTNETWALLDEFDRHDLLMQVVQDDIPRLR